MKKIFQCSSLLCLVFLMISARPAFSDTNLLASQGSNPPNQAGVSQKDFLNKEVYPQLTVYVTTNPYYEVEFTWEFLNLPETQSYQLLNGDVVSHIYSFYVDKDTVFDASVSGYVYIMNQTAQDAVITSVEGLAGDITVQVDCHVPLPYTLVAGDELTCTYLQELPDTNMRTFVATVYTTGDVQGNTAEDLIYFWEPAGSVTLNQVTVSDTNGQSWTIDAPDTLTYTRDFTCYNSSGMFVSDATYPNTATIYETGGTFNASVDINCFDIQVSTTANPSFDRTYGWEIFKNHDAGSTCLNLQVGTPYTVNYTVDVNLDGYSQGNWGVSGNIYVNNTAPMAATISEPEDWIGSTRAPVSCGVSFPYALPAGNTLTCSYTTPLTSSADATNSVSVGFQKHNYSWVDGVLVGVPGTYFYNQGSTPFSFAGATPTNVLDTCVTVTDTQQGSLGTVCITEAPENFTFQQTITPSSEDPCDTNILIESTASLTTNDNHYSLSDSDTVCYTVPCVTSYQLEVDLTATASFTRTYDWLIENGPNANVDLFNGDTYTHQYLVEVDQTITDSDYSLSGTLTIHNPAPCLVYIDLDGSLGKASGLNEIFYDCTFPLYLEAGATVECHYSVALTGPITGPFNIAVYLADTPACEVLGGNDSAEFAFGEPTTIVGFPQVHVDDPYYTGMDTPFSGDGSLSFQHFFPSGTSGTTVNENTACIRETAQCDTATVTINQYDLLVTTTAAPAFDRTYNWGIYKSYDVEANCIELNYGQTVPVYYTVDVFLSGFTDNNHAVSGIINVYNPSSIAIVINELKDMVGTDIQGSILCGEGFPYFLNPGQTLTCSYNASLPNGTYTTNTATAGLQNFAYALTSQGIEGYSTTTQYFSGSAGIDFAGTAPNEIDECVSVTDTQYGELGTVCNSTAPATYNYTRDLTPSTEDICGTTYSIDNTATLTGNDSGNTESASSSVCYTIPCAAQQLVASVTAVPSFTRTYSWNIANDPEEVNLHLFPGDTYVHVYNIDVTRSIEDSDWNISGTLTVTNPASCGVTIDLSQTPGKEGGIADYFDCTFPRWLAAGDTLVCNYSVPLPFAMDGTVKILVDVVGTPECAVSGTTAIRDVAFGDPTSTVGSSSVNVTDSNGQSALFEDSGSIAYSWNYYCGMEGGKIIGNSTTYVNTATITETGQSDEASVTIHCYDLFVSTTADPAYDRTHEWDLYEYHDAGEACLNLNYGSTYTVNYTVDVVPTFTTDGNWRVNGDIYISNPNPVEAVINSVNDLISYTIYPGVTCPVTFPYTLGEYTTLTCHYNASLPYGTGGTNTATAVLQNYKYLLVEDAIQVEPYGSYTHTYSGSAVYTFAGVAPTEKDLCAEVYDQHDGMAETYLGRVCEPLAEFPYRFHFSRDIGITEGEYTCDSNYVVSNTSRLVTADTGIEETASAPVCFYIPCEVCDGAYAKGAGARCFLRDGFSTWGWTNPISGGTYTWPLYAGAGQCDPAAGTLVGTVTVAYVKKSFKISYDVMDGYLMNEVHFYVGKKPYPRDPSGSYTVAPGQYGYGMVLDPPTDHYEETLGSLKGDLWVIAYAKVCGDFSKNPSEPTLANAGLSLEVAPNPFREEASIRITASENTPISVEIYNLAGIRVATLYEGSAQAYEIYTFRFSTPEPQQLFMVVVRTPSGVTSTKMLKVR